jgi:hypothetical protein
MPSESIDEEPVKMNATIFDTAMPRFANNAAITARDPSEVLTAAYPPESGMVAGFDSRFEMRNPKSAKGY